MAKIKNIKVLERMNLLIKAGYKNVTYKNKKIYAFQDEYVIIDYLDNSPSIYFLTNF